ncbi:MAG: phosphotransferase [Chthoniobacteraceae bacterium]
MSLEKLILQTQEKFPECCRDRVEISPLEKGGSDRKFYRISMGDENPVILVKYSSQKEENRHYVSIAQFLGKTGVNVPRIYFHDETEGLIWMEDLGEVDLWEHREEPWSQLSLLYRSALDQARLLHTRAHVSPGRSSLQLQKEFNAELYLWEQNYFFENCLGRWFKVDQAIIDSHQHGSLENITTELASLPRVLLHRDFQSQNIMIKNGDAFLIDFQGLRPGLAQYDLASLIYDPYVTLTEPQRKELLDYYIGKSIDEGVAVDVNFHRVFDLCAVQRLMQALGAYGYLGLVMSRETFLGHIPPALKSLKLVVSRVPELQGLGVLLDSIQ